MHEKIKKVMTLLRRGKADALLVWNQEGSGQPATAWMSGFTGMWSILLMVRSTPSSILPRRSGDRRKWKKRGIRKYLITDGRYTTQAKRETKGWKIFITTRQRPAYKILGELIEKEKVRKILFDGSVTPYSVVEELKKSLERTTPAAADGVVPFAKGDNPIRPVAVVSKKRILQELRVVKEKGEIKILAEAAARAGKAFMRLTPLIRVGMTERDIAELLEALCREEGAEGFVFPTSVASGKNGALPHAKATNKKIKKGELITVDFGIRYKGYCSDMTRMLSVGKVSPRLLQIYETVRKAQELGCKKAKAGMTGQQLDAICRNLITKSGFGKYFTHSTGHGLGMEVHELPIASPTPSQSYSSTPSPRRLGTSPLKRGSGGGGIPAGAVITCEPGVYIPNVGGVRIEDTLVLTKNGNINLTEGVTKELIVIY